MSLRVIITARAEADMQDAARWWASERSVEQAGRWLAGLDKKLKSLTDSPTRWPVAAKSSQFPYELRELHYGLAALPTHRAILHDR